MVYHRFLKSCLTPFFGLLVCLGLPGGLAAQDDTPLEAAAVLVSTEGIDHNTAIEMAYPRPMVAENRVGQPCDPAPAKITPSWKGTWKWQSPRVARFFPEETPKLSTTYTFTPKSGQKDLEGGRVPVDEEVSVKTAGFAMVTQTSPIPADGQAAGPRQTPMLLLFNAAVQTESLKNNLEFRDLNGNRQPATWRPARWSELSEDARGHLTLGQRVLLGKPSLSGNEIPEKELSSVVPWALVVQPAAPLPAGEKWAMVMNAGISAADGSKDSLGEASQLAWGTIEPGEVRVIEADAPVDGIPSIGIYFDKRIADDVAAVMPFIKVSPEPATPPVVTINATTVRLESPDFKFNTKYTVQVQAGLPAEDGLPIATGKADQELVFEPNRPSVALPSTTEVQLVNGRGVYPIDYVNVRDLHVKVMEVAAEDLPKLLKAYNHYLEGMGSEGVGRQFGFPLAPELLPGAILFEEKITLDPEPAINRSGRHELHWEKILSGKRPAALFVHIEGHRGFGNSESRVALAQAMVQVTDLGVAWKFGDEDLMAYVFSHTSGGPVGECEIIVQDLAGKTLVSTRTDANGLVRFPKPENASTLLAKTNQDTHLVQLELEYPNYSPWRLGASYFDWRKPSKDTRNVFLFSDRNVYRPGETVHLGGFARDFKGTLPVLPTDTKGTVTFHDDDNQVFHTEEVTFGSCGQFGLTVTLPEVKVGYFRASLRLPATGGTADEEADETDGDDGEAGEESGDEDETARRSKSFSHFFMVQEFKRNTFELSMQAPDSLTGESSVKLPLLATYYLGSPVSRGDVRWTAHFSSQGFYPENWRDYLFADHREFDGGYWSHYYGLDYYYAPERSTAYVSGEGKLDPVGATTLAVDIPAENEFPSPRRAFFTAEVTDPNQQTLSVQKETMLHPADFYLGAQRPPDLVKAGDTLELPVVAVTPAGELFATPTQVTVRVEKEIWNTVEVKAAGGGLVKRNESHMEEISSSVVALDGGKGLTKVSFPDTGVYHVVLEARDPAGRLARTTIAITVEGREYYAWEGRQGVRIDLLPDKKLYQPGDTARLLVKTPIEGTALVTVEREGIERAFVTKLTGSAPVIEVPLTDMDAPNTHVGVMIIEGTATSKMKYPLPRAKFGYARLMVEQRLPRLDVAIQPARESVRPGADASVAVKVTDHSGKPVANAAVVFYAVDEGVLAVAGYENPVPLTHFHAPRSLRVQTSATFPMLMPEDPEELGLYNKGYIIGGGGEEASPMKPRTDFTPCAFFSARIKTNENGTANVTFKTPDTLTRYRMIAVVAAADGWRFGTGTADQEVNKPLMLEPAPPRFAHVGDTLVVRAQVINQSPVGGLFSVVLDADSSTALQSTPRSEIAVAAGASETVEFTVNFTKAGQTTWKWQVTPVRFDSAPPPDLEAEMVDAVQSTFPVEHPIPILREVFAAQVAPGSPDLALLDQASPNLRAGDGEVRVTVANTRLIDALAATNHLLHYPYGCAEQTSSGLMPWLATDALRDLMPEAVDPVKVKKAVSIAVARLSSMQTSSGGLGYWPGAGEPNIWASTHAAQVLLLARAGGHDVPDSLIDPLVAFLKGQAATEPDKDQPWLNGDRVRMLYVLSMAGSPDLALMNRFFDDRAKLGSQSLSYLALAFASVPDGKDRARELLALPGIEERWTWWYGVSQLTALRIQAMATVGVDRSQVDPLMDELVAARSRAGDWGSTYTNSASLLAFGAYHRTYEKNFGASKVVVTWEGQSREVVLDAKPSRQTLIISLAELPPQARPVARLADGASPAYLSTELSARPAEMPRKRSSPVFGVERVYRKVQPDGSLAAAESFKVGDLVAVTLNVRASEGRRFVVVDDPLPSSLEAINPDFKSQGGSEVAMANASVWASDHTELRDSRALFFCDHLYEAGDYTLTYLARVTKTGNVLAPPTKVEAMYDPDLTALGEGGPFRTHP